MSTIAPSDAGSSEATLLERARRVMPGGVSSPVRAFHSVDGDPPFVLRGEGATITDRNERTYIDLVCSWGPLILGHAHPSVVDAVDAAVRRGLTFGATCEDEVRLAERILDRYCFCERVRFVNSGTEAVMSAVRLARGVTGRARVVKFEGCYHGHVDALLVKGGSGLATFGTPSSAGVPEEFTKLTDVLPLGDLDALEALMADHGSEVAAVIVEPLPANAGLLVQSQEYLEGLRRICDEHGALLIFDEVISGFRVASSGMCEAARVMPDLVTVGKIVGGGMPVGAYLGPARFMDQVAPLGKVYQAGTLSGNPVGMAAGIATLDELAREGTYERLEATAKRLEDGWRAALEASGIPGSVTRVASILWLCLQDGPAPTTYPEIRAEGAELYGRLHRKMMERGVWMAPSAYEVAFVSTAHTDEHIDHVVHAMGESLAALAAEG